MSKVTPPGSRSGSRSNIGFPGIVERDSDREDSLNQSKRGDKKGKPDLALSDFTLREDVPKEGTRNAVAWHQSNSPLPKTPLTTTPPMSPKSASTPPPPMDRKLLGQDPFPANFKGVQQLKEGLQKLERALNDKKVDDVEIELAKIFARCELLSVKQIADGLQTFANVVRTKTKTGSVGKAVRGKFRQLRGKANLTPEQLIDAASKSSNPAANVAVLKALISKYSTLKARSILAHQETLRDASAQAFEQLKRQQGSYTIAGRELTDAKKEDHKARDFLGKSIPWDSDDDLGGGSGGLGEVRVVNKQTGLLSEPFRISKEDILQDINATRVYQLLSPTDEKLDSYVFDGAIEAVKRLGKNSAAQSGPVGVLIRDQVGKQFKDFLRDTGGFEGDELQAVFDSTLVAASSHEAMDIPNSLMDGPLIQPPKDPVTIITATHIYGGQLHRNPEALDSKQKLGLWRAMAQTTVSPPAPQVRSVVIYPQDAVGRSNAAAVIAGMQKAAKAALGSRTTAQASITGASGSRAAVAVSSSASTSTVPTVMLSHDEKSMTRAKRFENFMKKKDDLAYMLDALSEKPFGEFVELWRIAADKEYSAENFNFLKALADFKAKCSEQPADEKGIQELGKKIWTTYVKAGAPSEINITRGDRKITEPFTAESFDKAAQNILGLVKDTFKRIHDSLKEEDAKPTRNASSVPGVRAPTTAEQKQRDQNNAKMLAAIQSSGSGVATSLEPRKYERRQLQSIAILLDTVLDAKEVPNPRVLVPKEVVVPVLKAFSKNHPLSKMSPVAAMGALKVICGATDKLNGVLAQYVPKQVGEPIDLEGIAKDPIAKKFLLYMVKAKNQLRQDDGKTAYATYDDFAKAAMTFFASIDPSSLLKSKEVAALLAAVEAATHDNAPDNPWFVRTKTWTPLKPMADNLRDEKLRLGGVKKTTLSIVSEPIKRSVEARLKDAKPLDANLVKSHWTYFTDNSDYPGPKMNESIRRTASNPERVQQLRTLESKDVTGTMPADVAAVLKAHYLALPPAIPPERLAALVYIKSTAQAIANDLTVRATEDKPSASGLDDYKTRDNKGIEAVCGQIAKLSADQQIELAGRIKLLKNLSEVAMSGGGRDEKPLGRRRQDVAIGALPYLGYDETDFMAVEGTPEQDGNYYLEPRESAMFQNASYRAKNVIICMMEHYEAVFPEAAQIAAAKSTEALMSTLTMLP
jgi:hypothetical protein